MKTNRVSGREVSNLIFSSLRDQALRVVSSVIVDPAEMMSNIKSRYGFRTTATMIEKCPNSSPSSTQKLSKTCKYNRTALLCLWNGLGVS